MILQEFPRNADPLITEIDDSRNEIIDHNASAACATRPWKITRETAPEPNLLPPIATMRVTVLNFSFARKLQSKLSSSVLLRPPRRPVSHRAQ